MLVRKVVVSLMVVALAIGVWALWPREGDEPTATTVPVAAATTTTTSTVPVTNKDAGTTTTTGLVGPRVVETVEEAEAILRELWFGWFEGIYHQDEDRIREVVGADRHVDAARNQFGVMEFSDEPTPEGLIFSEIEILRSDEECLVLWSSAIIEFRNAESEGVDVMRRRDNTWVLLSSWVHREDLWDQDCDAVLFPLQQG